ncbi:MAG TPA: LytR C-terminal domain-containing protein [Kofleriaceae bacterium]|nr:LytR C-terminal domain-containing protein [Kofleriaceae bacterium]
MLPALLPFVAVASTFDPGGAKLLGWSADGHYLVWTKTVIESSMPEGEGEEEMYAEPTTDETATVAIVRDVRRGDEQEFVLEYKAVSKTGRTKAALKTKLAKDGDAKAFEAWKKANPLTLVAGRKGPGKVDVVVKFTGDSAQYAGAAKWKGNSIKWTVEDSATATLSVTCGKETRSVPLQQQMEAMYAPTWTTTPYWDPTGHRVLFAMQEAQTKTMRGMDGGRTQYVIVACGARVEVVAPPGLEAATGKVADAVEKVAGYTVVSIGAAKQQRPATVIYADTAHKDTAAPLATAIPGGATVEKLDWKPQAELVVAIGASAK